jgi:ferredoxin, 2Fe-2S
MAKLIVVTRDGKERSLEARPGLSVMQILKDGGVDELLALCGGSCSCATCHVYLEPAQFAALPPPAESESDLLDGSDRRQPTSRLSCQLHFTAALDGMKVTVAPED